MILGNFLQYLVFFWYVKLVYDSLNGLNCSLYIYSLDCLGYHFANGANALRLKWVPNLGVRHIQKIFLSWLQCSKFLNLIVEFDDVSCKD